VEIPESLALTAARSIHGQVLATLDALPVAKSSNV
jgi:hypothetical protein